MAVIRAPLEQYPPSLNQIALFSEAGLSVTVVDTHHDDYPLFQFECPEKVERVHAVEHTQNYKEVRPSLLERVRRAYQFRRRVRNIISSHKPSVVVAYDPNAMIAVGKLWNRRRHAPRLIWHYHELFLPDDARGGVFSQRAVHFAARHCDRPDLVVFPDSHRARVYREQVNLEFNEMIVMNCPRRIDSLPENRLSPRLQELGISPETKTVFFQGWIGPSRCFEAILESMSHWPDNTVFVLVGPVSDQYRNKLEQIASVNGMKHRVLFLGVVPYQELLAWTVGADIGLAIVSDEFEQDLSWRYSAGAVNKRFEYMAVGLPQVANTGPGMQEIIEDPGTGRLVRAHSSSEIGQAIHALLTEDSLSLMSDRARQAHTRMFCYEKQCQRLVEQVTAWAEERL